jgi:tRNA(Ile2)-agmatinylcytidine synthase
MYIAVDDTDSRQGMCTTYVLSEIILRSGLDLIGFPGLVRLNPAIQHKTRGNGALIANLGKGRGDPIRVGTFNGMDLFSYRKGTSVSDGEDLMDLAGEVINEMAELEEPETNPGIVVSENKFEQTFYWKAVREEVSILDAEKFIRNQGGRFRKIKNGRGIIGSAAAISWPGNLVTYEFLSYKYPNGTPIKSETKMGAAKVAERITGSFNNIDLRNGYPAIFPKERTPVVFGVRGTSWEHLANGAKEIIKLNDLDIDRSILYMTNQATDDHIIFDPESISSGSSYSIEGRISDDPYSITGGHYFSTMKSGLLELKIAAFEPTKEFRRIFSRLKTGDLVRVFGTFKDGCLNIEKLEVKVTSEIYRRLPPLCDQCGASMRSKGHNDYRCSQCGNRSSMPAFSIVHRDLQPGMYNVPVIARRHLSRPFGLELTEKGELVREVSA